MGTLHNIIGHFCTITKHKRLVMIHCFRIGLYRQGLLHDLSKYTLTEFMTGVRYFDGHQSPNTVERIQTGVSEAWLHHKGRNKHHYEYWIDYSTKESGALVGCRMPYRYVLEMFCDRVAASKVYKGKDYTDAAPYEYYARNAGKLMIHEKTHEELMELLVMLKDQGEQAAFAYARQEWKKRKKQKNVGL